jgi:hypothetical protein
VFDSEQDEAVDCIALDYEVSRVDCIALDMKLVVLIWQISMCNLAQGDGYIFPYLDSVVCPCTSEYLE